MPWTTEPPKIKAEEQLRIGEAAERLNINRETLRRYAKCGWVAFDLDTAPSTVLGREERTFMVFTGRDLLALWERKRKLKKR